MKLINEYKKWMKNDYTMPDSGLCNVLENTEYHDSFLFFEPTIEDFLILEKENKPTIFWAFGESRLSDLNRYYHFTPLRQTIVLLICAMHDEL
jgi:hypothetical protein